MRSICSQLCVLLTIFGSVFLCSCATDYPKSDINSGPPIQRICPSLGDIAIHIENKEYKELTSSISGCITDDQINSTYNSIFTNGYNYKFFTEALAAYASYNDFIKVLNLRHKLSFLLPGTKHVLDNYAALTRDVDKFKIFKEVMRCVLTLPEDAQPSICLDHTVAAIKQSPDYDIYQQTFGDTSITPINLPGRHSRDLLK